MIGYGKLKPPQEIKQLIWDIKYITCRKFTVEEKIRTSLTELTFYVATISKLRLYYLLIKTIVILICISCTNWTDMKQYWLGFITIYNT